MPTDGEQRTQEEQKEGLKGVQTIEHLSKNLKTRSQEQQLRARKTLHGILEKP